MGISDKLLVEIDLNNGELDDAVPALVYLTNELYESAVEISRVVAWNEKRGNDYELRWRFAEGEMSSQQIPLDVDFLFQLNETLKRLQVDTTESALHTLQERLEAYLPSDRCSLLAA